MEEGEGQNENSGESDEAPPKVWSHSFIIIDLYHFTFIVIHDLVFKVELKLNGCSWDALEFQIFWLHYILLSSLFLKLW